MSPNTFDHMSNEELFKHINALETLVLELSKELETMTDHASEQYPHFESQRGQDDIIRANKVLSRVKI